MHKPSAPPKDLAACAPPLETLRKPAFTLPEHACDTHAHVISADFARYPLVDDRSYTPSPAPEQAYLAMLDSLGLHRGVLVQPSIYGTDNRYMLEVMQRHRQRLRGVAVVDEHVGDAALEHMHATGVRGVRFNVLFRGGVDLNSMERLAARIAPLNWHVQFLIDVRHLDELDSRLKKLPCPIVIDHMGHLPASQGCQQQGFKTLCRNVAERGWWVKLSGAYRLCDSHPDYAEADRLARALIAQSVERMLWGSDWPHVALQRSPDTTLLLERLTRLVANEQQLRQILTDNPATLYDF